MIYQARLRRNAAQNLFTVQPSASFDTPDTVLSTISSTRLCFYTTGKKRCAGSIGGEIEPVCVCVCVCVGGGVIILRSIVKCFDLRTLFC